VRAQGAKHRERGRDTRKGGEIHEKGVRYTKRG
jgi:hypothetical protein